MMYSMWNLCAIQTPCTEINVHKYLVLDQVYKRTGNFKLPRIRLSCIMSRGGTTRLQAEDVVTANFCSFTSFHHGIAWRTSLHLFGEHPPCMWMKYRTPIPFSGAASVSGCDTRVQPVMRLHHNPLCFFK